ncbi:MAG: DNRLRE domain-containing protein [Clostridia bacterium]|nr:DNRLRE domain-containing protein [Clostridia bacterium]
MKKKLLSIILIVSILFTTIPRPTYAFVENAVSELSKNIIDSEIYQTDAQDLVKTKSSAKVPVSELTVLAEDVNRRDEYTKYFLLEDKSYAVVQYPYEVHYKDNDGIFQEIDNRLIVKEESNKSAYVERYTNKGNAFKTSFSQIADSNQLMSIQQGGFGVFFALKGKTNVLNSNNTSVLLTSNVLQKAELSENLIKISSSEAHIVKADLINEETVLATQSKKATLGDVSVNHKATSGVVYENILPNTDIQYILHGQNLKENIIIKSPGGGYAYAFELNLEGLKPELMKDGSIELYDINSRENVKFVIPAPYMYDANGEHSSAVAYQIEALNDGYILNVIADSQWIDDEARTFPIVIDPAIESKQNNIRIAYAEEGVNASSENHSQVYMDVGRYSWNDTSIHTSYGYFDIQLPQIEKGATVVAAQVNLFANVHDAVGNDTRQFNLHALTSGFDEKFIGWDNKPNHDSRILDYITYTPYKENGWYQFDATNIIQKWYSGQATQYGFCIKGNDATGLYKARFVTDRFWNEGTNSGAYPCMTVVYRNTVGLENYWSYTTMSSGNGGTYAVNNYNGNLVATQPLLSVEGNRLPVSIGLTYNSIYGTRNLSFSNVGFGWLLNYDMFVSYNSSTASFGYDYYYQDADGTRHYFYKQSDGTRVDEDGLGLTLEVTPGTSYVIKDKSGEQMIFNGTGKLVEIKGTHGDSILVTRDTEGKITKITDGAGRIYTLTYSNNKISSITAPDNQSVQLFYSDNNLTKINYYNDGTLLGATVLTYLHGYLYQNKTLQSDDATYNNEYITAAHNSSGKVSNLKYEKAHNVSWAINQQYDFSYNYNETVVVDKQNRKVTHQFDTYGHETGVIDHTGMTAYHQLVETSGITNGKVNPAANKVSTVSKLQQSNTNYLFNTGFDAGTSYWIASNDGNQAADRTLEWDSTYGRTGNGSVRVWRRQAPTSGASWLSFGQTVGGLPQGWYTLSGYVSTKGATISGYGATVVLQQLSSAGLSEKTQHSILVKKTDVDEWVRISATIYLDEGKTLKAIVGFQDGVTYGNTAWFDDLQLEYHETLNQRNLLENTNFLRGINNGQQIWSYTSGTTTGTGNNPSGMGSSILIYGIGGLGNHEMSSAKIAVKGQKGDVYSFGAWAKGCSAANNGINREVGTGSSKTPYYQAELRFFNGDSMVQKVSVKYNPHVDDWQFASKEAISNQVYTHVQFVFSYTCNVNYTYVALPYIYKEAYGQSFTYDNNGNVANAKDLAETQSTFAYSNNDLAKITSPTGGSFMYSEDEATRNLLCAHSTAGQMYAFQYDSKGNPISTVISGDSFSTLTDGATSAIENGKIYFLRNAYSGLTLDSGNTGNNSLIKNYNYIVGSPFQKWKVALNGLSITLQSTSNTTLYANIQSDNSLRLSTQKTTFTISDNGDGTVSLKYNDMYLDGRPDLSVELKNNVPVKMVASSSAPTISQKWYFYSYDNATANTKQMTSSATYTADQNQIASVTDSAGGTTNYAYSSQGATKYALVSEQDSKGNFTIYQYDANRRPIMIIKDDSKVNYTYDPAGRLSTVEHNTLSAFPAVKYRFGYDDWSRNTTVSVESPGMSGTTLVTNFYNDNNLLTQALYGNGQSVSYLYDNLDRLISKTASGVDGSYAYVYNQNGQIGIIKDTVNGYDTKYLYDLAGRLSEMLQLTTENGSLLLHTLYNYDSKNRLQGYETNIPAVGDFELEAEYGDISKGYDPDRVYGVNINGTQMLRYGYDYLGRKTWSDLFVAATNAKRTAYTYRDISDTQTTSQIAKITLPDGTEYRYEYDVMGNITHIQEYASTGTTYNTYYQYDSQNQLIREDNERQGVTYTYTYDRGGNLLQKKCYSYTTGNLPSTPNQQYEYTYGGATATWQDQLTGYNGETITYDGVGNPLTYRGGMEFTWQAGRELAGMEKDGVSATYKYNSDGIRTEKVVNGVKTVYYIVDNAVVAESRSNGVNILYLFDESGTRIGMTYNGQNYYYLFNVQGDVTAIMNSSGTVEYRYVYDAWGKLVGIYNGSGQDVTDDTALANVGYHNPIRYRGYYYDNETGLYYVSSRYYDPEIGRWINADDIAYLGTGGLTSYNLFAYCGNNPVMGYDPYGTFDFWGFAKGVGRIVTGIAAVAAGVAVCVAGAPVAMIAVAAVTITAGVLTAVNGAADIQQSVTGNNFVRDTVFNGNQTTYDVYSGVTETVAAVGTAVCGKYVSSECVMKGSVPGTEGSMKLEPGMTLDRYGSQFGRYLTDPGTHYSLLDLPASNSLQLNSYRVLKSFRVSTGIVANGGGFQYFSWMSVRRLIQFGFLELL